MQAYLTRNALLLGNFVTGVAVLAPAGMLNELSADLGVSIQVAGWLVTFGAVILCFGSPLMAWATSRLERRTLLTWTLAIAALGHAVSALAPDYATLLTARLLLLAVLAVYTPQAAATIGLVVSEKERPSAMAYVFLGWPLAVAFGLPLITLLAAHVGWRSAYGAIAVVAAITAALNAYGLPAGLRGATVSLKSWAAIGRNRRIVLLLLITVLLLAGNFQIFIYLGPLLKDLAGASPQTIGLAFASLGITGVIGNMIAMRFVGSVGAFRVSLVLFVVMLLGYLAWSVGTGVLAIMLLGTVLIGLGVGAQSMQQARLAAAAPELAGASIALNTSALYVGQAIGSAVGGALIVRDLAPIVGYGAAIFMVAALLVLFLTRDESRAIRAA
jgi:MFS transporter, DHA1 family, inner membrane transport protein